MSQSQDPVKKALNETHRHTVTLFFTNMLSGINNKVMPFVAVVIILVAAVDSALTRVKQVPNLNQTAQGAIVTIVIAYIASRAYQLLKK